MSPRIPPMCYFCKHYTGNRKYRTCEAFRGEIPWQIWENRIPHYEPFPGDRGIRFSPKTKDAKEMYGWMWERYEQEKRRRAEVGAREEEHTVVTRRGKYLIEPKSKGGFQVIWRPYSGEEQVLSKEFVEENDAKDAAWDHYWKYVEGGIFSG